MKNLKVYRDFCWLLLHEQLDCGGVALYVCVYGWVVWCGDCFAHLCICRRFPHPTQNLMVITSQLFEIANQVKPFCC